MKLVNTPNNKFVDADPKTLTAGTPIPASTMNALQDEIANVVTGYGLTLDDNNDAQMKAALDGHFAPINSPSLTGIPLTTNPDGNTDNQIATVAYVKQYGTETSLGYQAVQQGGGTNMGTNKIYMGADTTDNQQIRVQIDSNQVGKLVLQEDDSSTYGVNRIGFNHPGNTFTFFDTGTKQWHFCYTTDQIDGKSFISSLPDGNNQKVSDIIWNTSSNLPALYYGSNNSVDYLATSDWSNNTFQLKGDYSTNTTVNNYVTSLQNQINNRVQKPGDTMTGTLTIEGNTGGFVAQYNPGSPSSGTFVNYPGFVSIAEGRGGEFHLQIQEDVGSKFIGLFSLKSSDGNWRYMSIPQGSRINDSTYGDVAYTNDLQSYVPTSTYTSDFSTSDSRIINLAYGHRIQKFQVSSAVHVDNGTWVAFPQSFSSDDVNVQVTTAGNNDMDVWAFNATANGFYINIPYAS
ncbi:hypothetical protein KBX73_14825 [Acetobacter persici]|nr:hypothetical protein [Acetobacter persici]MCP9321018.1 hypothetical protein [Acetobacter persici]